MAIKSVLIGIYIAFAILCLQYDGVFKTIDEYTEISTKLHPNNILSLFNFEEATQAPCDSSAPETIPNDHQDPHGAQTEETPKQQEENHGHQDNSTPTQSSEQNSQDQQNVQTQENGAQQTKEPEAPAEHKQEAVDTPAPESGPEAQATNHQTTPEQAQTEQANHEQQQNHAPQETHTQEQAHQGSNNEQAAPEQNKQAEAVPPQESAQGGNAPESKSEPEHNEDNKPQKYKLVKKGGVNQEGVTQSDVEFEVDLEKIITFKQTDNKKVAVTLDKTTPYKSSLQANLKIGETVKTLTAKTVLNLDINEEDVLQWQVGSKSGFTEFSRPVKLKDVLQKAA